MIRWLSLVSFLGTSFLWGSGAVWADANSDSAASTRGVSQAAKQLNRWTLRWMQVAFRDAPNDNVILSGPSLFEALANVYAGSKTATKREFEKVFGVTKKQTSWWDGFFRWRHRTFHQMKTKVRLRSVHRVWVAKGTSLLASYTKLLRDAFQSKVEIFDGKGDLKASVAAVNAWVSKQTLGMIPQLLDAKDTGLRDVRVLLANAVALEGAWKFQFDPKKTKVGRFYLTKEKAVEIPMMTMDTYLPMFRNETVTLVELPYRGERFSMLLLLPLSPRGLPRLVQRLSPKLLKRWGKKLRAKHVELTLPKFQLTTLLDGKALFRRIGLQKVFSVKADLSGINGKKDLFVGTFQHKVRLEMDEQGTRASASSLVRLRPKNGGVKYVRVQHPFLLLLREKSTGAILFAGQIRNPAPSAKVIPTRSSRILRK